MTDQTSFVLQVHDLRETINNLTEECSADNIEQTAARLEGLNYTPPVITPIAAFLRMDKPALLREIERILAMPDQEACALAPDNTKKCEDLRLEYMGVILYYYKKLLLLRQGNIEEWDEVDELYVHD